jgi:hypothetical protein
MKHRLSKLQPVALALTSRLYGLPLFTDMVRKRRCLRRADAARMTVAMAVTVVGGHIGQMHFPPSCKVKKAACDSLTSR